MGTEPDPRPPHDCRLTARCFRESFGFKIHPPYDFSALRSENSGIDKFFSLREPDPDGGEGGERVQSVTERPVFALHSGKMRGATWFDREQPHAIVWLLAFEQHDERHKGSGDAYDIFARLEGQGRLYPVDVDYKLLELARRARDTEGFRDAALADAKALLAEAVSEGAARGTTASVETRVATIDGGNPTILGVALSMKPIRGELSQAVFPLTEDRFLLLATSFENAARELFGDAEAEVPSYAFPGGLSNERAFQIAFAP